MESIENKKEIILIGNGPSVLRYKVGNLIDQFVDVVRFNNYQTSSFEEYVGTKTTIWARNNSRGVKERDWNQYKKIFVVSPEWNFKNTSQIVAKYPNAFLIPREDALEVQILLKLSGNKGGSRSGRGWPTSGVITLYHLLKKYSIVYIHGFDHFKGENHYFDKEKMLSFTLNVRAKEEEWVNSKISEGRVIRLIQ